MSRQIARRCPFELVSAFTILEFITSLTNSGIGYTNIRAIASKVLNWVSDRERTSTDGHLQAQFSDPCEFFPNCQVIIGSFAAWINQKKERDEDIYRVSKDKLEIWEPLFYPISPRALCSLLPLHRTNKNDPLAHVSRIVIALLLFFRLTDVFRKEDSNTV